jgi:hypothetical protein
MPQVRFEYSVNGTDPVLRFIPECVGVIADPGGAPAAARIEARGGASGGAGGGSGGGADQDKSKKEEAGKGITRWARTVQKRLIAKEAARSKIQRERRHYASVDEARHLTIILRARILLEMGSPQQVGFSTRSPVPEFAQEPAYAFAFGN